MIDHWANGEDFNHTEPMSSLIWVLARRTPILLVLSYYGTIFSVLLQKTTSNHVLFQYVLKQCTKIYKHFEKQA